MSIKLIITTTLLLATIFANAQTTYLRINQNIVLPKDSIECNVLTTSINDFLLSAQKPNEENKFVFEGEKIETFILLDEINGIEKASELNDNNFFIPYLTNIIKIEDNNYFIQVSYIGIYKNNPFLRASFEFIAHKKNNSFTFSSPLLRNTKNWKVLIVGNNVFHYEATINKAKVKEFKELANSFDKKLKVANKQCEYYLTTNFVALQKLIGVAYKSDYNGYNENTLSSDFGNKRLIILGSNSANFDNFDPHDLFHDRLSLVIPRNKVNKPVDEGCAYLYGGSWGFTWKEIFKAFKEQIASNKNTNWIEIKETPILFNTGKYPNPADYIVNALLVKKIEKEKDFAGVWKLLNVGPFEKGNEKYYQMLEKLTGITKANYNDKIWELINNEK